MINQAFEDKRLLEALNFIDERFIAEVTEDYEIFDTVSNSQPSRKMRFRTVSRYIVLAACLLLFACATPILSYIVPQIGELFGGNAGNIGDSETVDFGEFADMSERDLIEHIGKVPKEFQKIIENNLFKRCYPTGDHVFVTLYGSEGVDYIVYDKYGNVVDEIDLENSSADTYRVYRLSDGNYIKVRAYDLQYKSVVGSSTLEEVEIPASVEKFTPDGKTIFETEFDILGDLDFFCEIDDGYIVSSYLQNWAHIDSRGFYIYKLDKSGNIVHQRIVSNGDEPFKVECENGEAVLYCRYYKWGDDNKKYSVAYKKIYLTDTLSTRATVDISVGDADKIEFLNTDNYYSYIDIRDFVPDFDAGGVSSVIYYDDFVLIVSHHATKMFEYVPLWYSSIPAYTETVYTAYTYDAEIIWRSAVDSTDYERLAEIKKEYDEWQSRFK